MAGLCGCVAGRVLPAMKHAAEELRSLGVSPGGGTPSLRQAARSSSAVLNGGDGASERILQLHTAVTTVCGED